MSISLTELKQAAMEFAREGGDSTLNYFNESFELEIKDDDSPVTNADREAESIIRKKIRKHFPGHGIIGEEFGKENEDSDVVWILDPIDGTKSFIHGVPFYTTLIGVLVKNKPEIGVIYAPALNEIVSAAKDLGCYHNGEKTSVRTCSNLSDATFLSTDVTSFEEHGFQTALMELLQSTRIHRTWGDAYGHMLVATGRADIMIDAILHIWDAAALLPIITEAGGAFSDVNGHATIESGNAISTNKTLKDKIVHIFENQQ